MTWRALSARPYDTETATECERLRAELAALRAKYCEPGDAAAADHGGGFGNSQVNFGAYLQVRRAGQHHAAKTMVGLGTYCLPRHRMSLNQEMRIQSACR